MNTAYGVRLHSTRKMRDGSREWTIPVTSFYAGRKNGEMKTTSNHVLAVPMTQELAGELSAKLNSTRLQSEVCEIFADPDTVIHDSMVSIGEAVPPPPAPPDSVDALTKSIERCYDDGLTSLEILHHCCRVVLG